jgi:hypothetical protein
MTIPRTVPWTLAGAAVLACFTAIFFAVLRIRKRAGTA